MTTVTNEQASQMLQQIKDMCRPPDDIIAAHPEAFRNPVFDKAYCDFMSRDTDGTPDPVTL